MAISTIQNASLASGVPSSSAIGSGTITQSNLASNVSGTGPTFSATISSDQTVSSGVWTKMQFNTEQFDTNSNFDSSTNYRFTPTVAGYYQVNLTTTGGTTGSYQAVQTSIYKNGSAYCSANWYLSGNYIWGGAATATAVIYFNGSTDYVEGYIFLAGGGTLSASSNACRFSGSLIRGA